MIYVYVYIYLYICMHLYIKYACNVSDVQRTTSSLTNRTGCAGLAGFCPFLGDAGLEFRIQVGTGSMHLSSLEAGNSLLGRVD